MSILEVKDLRKIYGGKNGVKETKALKGVSFEIEEGELVAIMGPSGSGKTTLLNLLSGIDNSTSGSVVINNKNISKMKTEEIAVFRRNQIGFVFQNFNLLDTLTVKENILLPTVFDKCNISEVDNRAEKIINSLELNKIQNKYPYSISGGQQQRTAVARALINNPSIILADEPTGNLDSKSAKNIMETFGRMNDENKATILIVTHDVFAASYCKKVIFIKDGQLYSEVIKKGTRREFFDSIINTLALLGGEGYDL